MLPKKNKTVKIIIESGILSDAEIIRCCELYSAANVDFLKTNPELTAQLAAAYEARSLAILEAEYIKNLQALQRPQDEIAKLFQEYSRLIQYYNNNYLTIIYGVHVLNILKNIKK